MSNMHRVLHFVSHATVLLRKFVACDMFVICSRQNFLVLILQNIFSDIYDVSNSCRTISLIYKDSRNCCVIDLMRGF